MKVSWFWLSVIKERKKQFKREKDDSGGRGAGDDDKEQKEEQMKKKINKLPLVLKLEFFPAQFSIRPAIARCSVFQQQVHHQILSIALSIARRHSGQYFAANKKYVKQIVQYCVCKV